MTEYAMSYTDPTTGTTFSSRCTGSVKAPSVADRWGVGMMDNIGNVAQDQAEDAEPIGARLVADARRLSRVEYELSEAIATIAEQNGVGNDALAKQGIIATSLVSAGHPARHNGWRGDVYHAGLPHEITLNLLGFGRGAEYLEALYQKMNSPTAPTRDHVAGLVAASESGTIIHEPLA